MNLPAYIFSREKENRIKELYNVMLAVGADVEMVDSLPFIEISGAVRMDNQYVFNPVKFINALNIGCEIYEHTRAINIDTHKKIIKTDRGNIRAKTIIIATHYPIINSKGGYIFKIRQSNSYAIAVKGVDIVGAYLEEIEEGLSIRPYSEGVIIGGADHRSGRHKSDCYKKLEKEAKNIFGGDIDIGEYWYASDCMTYDGMPYIGRYSKNCRDIYVITGFNKWGMAISMTAADIICDLIRGEYNESAEIFDPQRRMKGVLLPAIKNVVVNIWCILSGYNPITFKSIDDIKPATGEIVWYRGKRRAVYREYDGRLHVIGRMCPHFHGELHWNRDTDCWECPCHGSRFDKYGNIISEPSVKCAKYKKYKE